MRARAGAICQPRRVIDQRYCEISSVNSPKLTGYAERQ